MLLQAKSAYSSTDQKSRVAKHTMFVYFYESKCRQLHGSEKSCARTHYVWIPHDHFDLKNTMYGEGTENGAKHNALVPIGSILAEKKQ